MMFCLVDYYLIGLGRCRLNFGDVTREESLLASLRSKVQGLKRLRTKHAIIYSKVTDVATYNSR